MRLRTDRPPVARLFGSGRSFSLTFAAASGTLVLPLLRVKFDAEKSPEIVEDFTGVGGGAWKPPVLRKEPLNHFLEQLRQSAAGGSRTAEDSGSARTTHGGPWRLQPLAPESLRVSFGTCAGAVRRAAAEKCPSLLCLFRDSCW